MSRSHVTHLLWAPSGSDPSTASTQEHREEWRDGATHRVCQRGRRSPGQTCWPPRPRSQPDREPSLSHPNQLAIDKYFDLCQSGSLKKEDRILVLVHSFFTLTKAKPFLRMFKKYFSMSVNCWFITCIFSFCLLTLLFYRSSLYIKVTSSFCDMKFMYPPMSLTLYIFLWYRLKNHWYSQNCQGFLMCVCVHVHTHSCFNILRRPGHLEI